MAKNRTSKPTTTIQFEYGKTAWQVRWTWLGRPTLLWLLTVLLLVAVASEVLFYGEWDIGFWFWGLAYAVSTTSLLLILRRSRRYFPDLSRVSKLLLLWPIYVLFAAALLLRAWQMLLHPPVVVQTVDEITDWRRILYVQVQQPALFYDRSKTEVIGNVYKHRYSAAMWFRVPMDQNGWVYLQAVYRDDWDGTADVQQQEQLQTAFIKQSRQRFDATDFSDALFYSVEAAPPDRGGYRNHANLQAHFESFHHYARGSFSLAAIVLLVLLISWFVIVRSQLSDRLGLERRSKR
jgi:hypothetical protein